MWWWIVSVALAGYGDARDGVPSPPERELHLWTNVARVDLEYFRDDLPCWDKIPSAQRRPLAPLAYSHPLALAARFHSEDMREHDPNRTGKALSHDSSDGTPMQERVPRWYKGYRAIGENVLFGLTDAYDAVAAWLCSDGHRANILEEVFEELGVGAALPYWTQDFGAGVGGPRPLSMGAHTPPKPRGEVELLVDAAGKRVEDVVAVLDGKALATELIAGSRTSGVWSVRTPVDAGCHFYWFEAVVDGEPARFPEHGAYGFGDCDWQDDGAQWISGGAVRERFGGTTAEEVEEHGDDETPGGRRRGCHTAGAGASWLALAVAGFLRRRAGRRQA